MRISVKKVYSELSSAENPSFSSLCSESILIKPVLIFLAMTFFYKSMKKRFYLSYENFNFLVILHMISIKLQNLILLK